MQIAENENSLFTQVLNMLVEFLPMFQEFGIHTDGPQIHRSKQSEQKYWSEIRIPFKDQEGIFDCIEFFIHHEGKLAASNKEILRWLNEEIHEMIERKRCN